MPPRSAPGSNGFWQVRELDLPRTGLTKYASMCPNIRRPHDATNGVENRHLREKIQTIIDGLMRHPEAIAGAESHITSMLRKLAAEAGGAADDVEATTLGRYDTNFMSAVVQKNSKLTRKALEKMKVYDVDSFRRLFYFGLNASPGLHLPTECNSRAIMSETCDARTVEAGRRLEGLMDSMCIDEGGFVNWHTTGVYELRWKQVDGGKVVDLVTHRPTKHTAKPHESVRISQRFNLEFAWSDTKARVSFGPSRYQLADAFDSDKGPNAKKQISGKSKVWNDMVKAKVAAAEERAKEAEHVRARPQEDIGVERKRARSEKNAERVRAALKARQQEMRGISLKG